MRPAFFPSILLLALAGTHAGAPAAEAFAAPGAQATLTVDYVYESAGKTQDRNDLREWRSRRRLSLSADLRSTAPTALPAMQALDGAQMAQLDRQATQMRQFATAAEPVTADVGKIMAKCGEDEACLERQMAKMGLAMAGTSRADAVSQAGRQAMQAVQPGAPRYQTWHATAQTGRYTIDDSFRSVLADPICQPTLRCTRHELRSGAGPVPPLTATARDVGLYHAVELDAAQNTLTLRLPVPLSPLPYTETITTDEPAGARDTPTPKGPQPKSLVFRTAATGQPAAITVALRGGWRSQSGEQVVTMKGPAGEGGRLTARWRFEAR